MSKRRPRFSLHKEAKTVDPEAPREAYTRDCFSPGGATIIVTDPHTGIKTAEQRFSERKGDPGTEEGTRYAHGQAFVANKQGRLRFANPHLHAASKNRYGMFKNFEDYAKSEHYLLRLINRHGRSLAAKYWPNLDWPGFYSGTSAAAPAGEGGIAPVMADQQLPADVPSVSDVPAQVLDSVLPEMHATSESPSNTTEVK